MCITFFLREAVYNHDIAVNPGCQDPTLDYFFEMRRRKAWKKRLTFRGENAIIHGCCK